MNNHGLLKLSPDTPQIVKRIPRNLFLLILLLLSSLAGCSAPTDTPQVSASPSPQTPSPEPDPTRVLPTEMPQASSTATFQPTTTATSTITPTFTHSPPSPTPLPLGNLAFISLTNLPRLELLARLDTEPRPGSKPSPFTLSYDSQRMAFGRGSSVILWNLPQNQIEAILNAPDTFQVFSGPLAISQDGSLLAATDSQNQITVWALDRGEYVRTILPPDADRRVQQILFSPDNQHLIAATSSNGSVTTWNAHSGELLHDQTTASGGEQDLLLSPNSRLMISTGQDGYLRFWDPFNGEFLTTRILYNCPSVTPLVSFAPGGQVIALQCYTEGSEGPRSHIYLYRPDYYRTGSLQLVSRVLLKEGEVIDLSFNRDAGLLALTTQGNPNQIELWSMVQREPARILTGFPSLITQARFTLEGRLLVVGTQGGEIQLWGVRDN